MVFGVLGERSRDGSARWSTHGKGAAKDNLIQAILTRVEPKYAPDVALPSLATAIAAIEHVPKTAQTR